MSTGRRQRPSRSKRRGSGDRDLPTREVGQAELHAFNAPLGEWLMSRFLSALDHLVKSGLRFTYHRVEEEQRFLRGRLEMGTQMREPLGRPG
jgi:5-methylcytosine-specific restriction enzyme subunit McrC